MNTQHAKESQCKMILAHLKEHGSIMPLQALNLYGIYRLGARIFDLRKDEHNIDTVMIYEHPVKFAKYVLKK
jgi:Helix-turn-helix domain